MASMDTMYQGAAIFSTHLGKYKPRNTKPPSIILRSNPDDDQDEMVARLQREFPEQCKLIVAPITNVAHYFDPYDMHQQGYRFLESVLGTIARHNWNRARNVQSFAEEWIQTNPNHFEGIMSMAYGAFAQTAHHTHGEEFGREVFSLIQGIRTYRSAPTGLQIHQPTYQSQTHGATPRSSSSHATLQPSSSLSKSYENTPSSHSRTHDTSPQSSSSQETRQPGPSPRKSRMHTPSQIHANGTSSKSSTNHGAFQSGSNPRKSRVNTSSSHSHGNGNAAKSSSSRAALQSGSNPRKSRVGNASSRSHANGTSSSHGHETSQNHPHGDFRSRAREPSQSYAYGTPQSHQYEASQAYPQGIYHQQPSDTVAFEVNPYRRQSVNQRSQYESLGPPGRAHFPPRRDFHSDPESYIRYPPKQYVGPIIVDSSPEQPGPFLGHYSLPNRREVSWPLRFNETVTVPNPVKTVSDDARVLEMQEAASRRILDDSNALEVSLSQQSAKSMGKLPDPELHSSALLGSNSRILCEKPTSSLLDKDPAVISVGVKPDRALEPNDHHSADDHRRPQDEKGRFLASLIQKDQTLVQQPSTPAVTEIGETDSLAGSHDAKDCATTRSNSSQGKFKFSNARSSTFQGNYYRNRYDTSHSDGKDTVWIGGLYPELGEAKVKEIFEPYGKITKVSKIFTRDSETRMAFAFVTFLTEEAAARAIDVLNFRHYENMTLKVRYAWHVKKYGDAIHRISPEESKFKSPSLHNTTTFQGTASPCESKGKVTTIPSLDRKYRDSMEMSPAHKAECLSKSKWQSGKAIETPDTVSGLSSRQNYEASFSGPQDGNVAAGSREVSESTKVTATVGREEKVTENSSKLSESLENISTTKEEVTVTKDSLTVRQSLQSSSPVEQGINTAKDSPELSKGLESSIKVKQEAVLDVPKQHKNIEPEQGSGAIADAPPLDSSIQDHSQKLPRKMPEIDPVLATEPQTNPDTDASISSLAAEDDSALPRMSHKVKWKLQQRATKAAKQKKILEKEQKKSGAKGVGLLTETSEEIIASDVKSDVTDPSGSKKIPTDTAQQQIKLETDPQISLDGNSQSESISLTESSSDAQNQVLSASKSITAPEKLPASVYETSGADEPCSSEQAKLDGTEGSTSSETLVITPQKKKKKKQKQKRKSSTAVQNAEIPSKPELSPSEIEKVTNAEILLDQVHEECAAHSVGSQDGNTETLIDKETMEHKHEAIGLLRTESVTPTQGHPDSTTAQPKNAKSKKARKSKGKRKAKSAEAVAAQSEEVAQASAVPSDELAEAAAILVQFLPRPETPSLANQTHDVLPVKIDEKEKGQTQTTPPIDSDEKVEGRAHIMLPVEINKKLNGHKKNEFPSIAEEPHVCSRRELTRYHHLKDRDYWPQLSKIIRGPTLPNPSLSMNPMPENIQDLEAGEPGVTHSQPMESSEANSQAPVNDSGVTKTAEDERKSSSPDAIVHAEQFLQTLDKPADTGSSMVAKPEPLGFEISPYHDSSAASGSQELSVPDSEVVVDHANISSGLSFFGQPVADLRSPPKSVTAFSDVAGRSKTPPLTPHTPYTRTCTESSSSPGILSGDESSESFTLQSEDGLTDNGGEEHATVTAEDGSPSPRMPPRTVYPFHPSTGSLGSAQLPWQAGDVLQVTTGDDGKKTLVNVSQDQRATNLSQVEVEVENERAYVERRDTRVILPEEKWGYSKCVWKY